MSVCLKIKGEKYFTKKKKKKEKGIEDNICLLQILKHSSKPKSCLTAEERSYFSDSKWWKLLPPKIFALLFRRPISFELENLGYFYLLQGSSEKN